MTRIFTKQKTNTSVKIATTMRPSAAKTVENVFLTIISMVTIPFVCVSRAATKTIMYVPVVNDLSILMMCTGTMTNPIVRSCYIHGYGYKPEPRFCKCRNEKKVRYYGVELEIDRGGFEEDNAEELYDIANEDEEVLYIKSDGSLSEGMELVSHPCSLKYHRTRFPWEDIMHRAVRLGYRSHNTSTCGLHIHVGKAQLGDTIEEQEDVIGRILFFFESHWNELFNFSRRTVYAVDRWAARQGYSDRPKDILDKAKKSSKGRYCCVNITNYATVEIRLFRGTLKYNTFIASLELVDEICRNAISLSDHEMHSQSWNDFVTNIDPDYTELIQYLKERRLYVNEPIDDAEEEL